MPYREFKAMLPIDKHDLDGELVRQSEILSRISDHRAEAKTKAEVAKDSLERVWARVYYDVMEDRPKPTVEVAKGITQRDPERVRAFQQYQEARQEFERWDGLYESWKARGFALKVLADLHLAHYYSPDSGGKPRDYQEGREALARRRTVRK